MKTVILAEKPSQARSYVEAFKNGTKKQGYYAVSDPVLPNSTVVTYGFGHLVELATPDKYNPEYKKWTLSNLPIFPDNYKFIVPNDKKAQFKVVKDLLKEADEIIVATDSDREGENIAWSIMNQANINLKRKTIKRLWINSLEKEAILNGFKNLKDGWQFYDRFKEAQTRQISDWLVGMNASPLYTLLLNKAGIQGMYSIGRVQTPTLYMVYQRDRTIKNFKPEPYFELNAEILAHDQKFVAKLDPYQRFKDEKGLITFMEAKNVQKGQQDGLIKDVQKQAKKSASPRLFSLSSLQSTINKKFHASANQTLQAVQSLYEAKLLTYPRTDSNYITEEEFNYLLPNLNQYLNLVSKEVSLNQTEPNKRYVNGKKVQEHHAIIMTKTVPTKEQLEQLPKLQQQIYNIVLRTTLAMFADPYEYEETTIITQIGAANFKATGKVPTKEEREAWKQQLIDNAEQKIVELTDTDKFKHYLDTLSKFHSYSMRNVQLIYSQNPEAQAIAGFKAWQNKFNRTVNKGEKSIRILAPVIKKLTPEDKARLNTTEDTKIVAYRYIPVFDISQTSGEPVLTARDFVKDHLTTNHENVTALYNEFKDYLNKNTDLKVSEKPLAGLDGAKGYFRKDTNEIVIGGDEPDSQLKLKTLYHEFAHSQLHGLNAEYNDRPRPYKETQAEAVAYVAMQKELILANTH